MAVKIKVEENGKIYAGTVLKNGHWGSHCNEVTEDAINAVFQHILNMRTTGDREETLEFKNPFYKWGKKKYKIEITLKPE